MAAGPSVPSYLQDWAARSQTAAGADAVPLAGAVLLSLFRGPSPCDRSHPCSQGT